MADAYSTKIYNELMGNGAQRTVQHLSASASAASATAFVGPVWFHVSGDLGGGTAVLYVLTSGATYVPVAGTSATAATDVKVDFPAGSRNTLQAVLLSGAAASADIILQGYGG